MRWNLPIWNPWDGSHLQTRPLKITSVIPPFHYFPIFFFSPKMPSRCRAFFPGFYFSGREVGSAPSQRFCISLHSHQIQDLSGAGIFGEAGVRFQGYPRFSAHGSGFRNNPISDLRGHQCFAVVERMNDTPASKKKPKLIFYHGFVISN